MSVFWAIVTIAFATLAIVAFGLVAMFGGFHRPAH
jgi:hypothetical protein